MEYLPYITTSLSAITLLAYYATPSVPHNAPPGPVSNTHLTIEIDRCLETTSHNWKCTFNVF